MIIVNIHCILLCQWLNAMKKANGAREVLAPHTAFKHIDRRRGTRAHTLTVLFCFVLFCFWLHLKLRCSWSIGKGGKWDWTMSGIWLVLKMKRWVGILLWLSWLILYLNLKNFKDKKLYISLDPLFFHFSSIQFDKLQLNAMSIGYWEFSRNQSEKSAASCLELDHTLNYLHSTLFV